ncbi:MAG: glutaredoxin family protein [Gammaproteobacteria bacterium]|nr:glutaredoxin family protein [Gammaproteobacteria bacterium]
MWQHLLEIQAGRNFELVRLDVDADSELQRQFGALVPVLTGGEQIICNYYLDPVALERYLSEIV